MSFLASPVHTAALLGLLSAFAFAPTGLSGSDSADPLSFRKEIRPVFREKCVHCHNRRTLPDLVGFDFRKRAFIRTRGGVPVIVPGRPEQSYLIRALTSPVVHEDAMPMVGPRPTVGEIDRIRRWILEGAEWPRGWAGRIRPTFYPRE